MRGCMRVVMLFVLAALLNGCASQYSSNSERNYLKAYNGPILQVPGSLSHQEISHYYDLPNPTGPGGVSIFPPIALN
jgi:uncharacterized lipoprotein